MIDETIARSLVYALLMVIGLVVVGGLSWREYDRRMDKVLMLDRETREPKVRRFRIDESEFTWKRGGGLTDLRVSIPPETDYAVWHQRGKASVVIINEKGHVLSVSSKDEAGNDCDGRVLRPWDAAWYQTISGTTAIKKAVQAYDAPKPVMSRTAIIIGLVVLLLIGGGAYFIGKGGSPGGGAFILPSGFGLLGMTANAAPTAAPAVPVEKHGKRRGQLLAERLAALTPRSGRTELLAMAAVALYAGCSAFWLAGRVVDAVWALLPLPAVMWFLAQSMRADKSRADQAATATEVLQDTGVVDVRQAAVEAVRDLDAERMATAPAVPIHAGGLDG